MRARRTDGNKQRLCKAWRKLGGSWLDIVPEHGGEPDALLGYRGFNVLVEVKDPEASKRDRQLRSQQVEWHSKWRGQKPSVVETLADMLRLFP